MESERPISEANWCLFLDVDGTLLEIADTPSAVLVDQRLLELLTRLQAALAGAVALISGRPVAELDRLFQPHRLPASGVHGLERRDPQGGWHSQNGVDVAMIAMARERLKRVADRLAGTTLEDKGLAVALHYRQVPQFAGLVRVEARSIQQAASNRLAMLEGRMVVELRPHGATKMEAIREFLKEMPFRGRRPIFIGDDATDERALEYVQRVGGLSVAVGDRVRGMVNVPGPREVRAFLERLSVTGVPPG
ncbi:MAG: trehalose-phosphatase [Steroidobacteraceae bacterium]